MSPRLTSTMLVSALIRQVNNAGGFAAVLAKGDPDAGAILLLFIEKGTVQSVRERILGTKGTYEWRSVGPVDAVERDEWLARRRARDPDLWIVELDIADGERFTAERGLTG
jgi:hypothetical protein